jgi:hypothetical protein
MSRRMKLLEDVAHTEEMRSVYRILVRKPNGKKLFGKPKNRREESCTWYV